MLIEIRPAGSEDLDQIVRLNVREYWDSQKTWQDEDQYNRWEQAGWWGDRQLLEWHFGILSRLNGGIILAIRSGQVVGQLDYIQSVGSSADEPNRLHIIWVLVDRNHRRVHIASRLLKYIQNFSSRPVWVEPEDERSRNLYQKFGSITKYLTNWILPRTGLTPFVKGSDGTLDQLFDTVINQHWFLIGNYYAPEFDYLQLKYSDPVHQFIWGNSPARLCRRYEIEQCRVIALLTQYPRIALSTIPSNEKLILIFSTICHDIFDLGFDNIQFQYYDDNRVNQALEQLGFQCIIEHDPVYSLFNR